ncbi:MAG: hypothetical protein ACI9JT_001579, partial [Polaribacter sp.]
STEINAGNYIGVDLNFITKKRYSFKIGYTGNLDFSK